MSKFDQVMPIFDKESNTIVGVTVTPASHVLERLEFYSCNEGPSLNFRVNCLSEYIRIKIGVMREKYCEL